LALAFDALPTLEQLRLLRGERGQVVLFRLRPPLMQLGNHTRCPQELAQRLPDHRIEPVRPHQV